MRKSPPALRLIEGKRDENERLLRRLRAAPEQFDDDVFDELLERFRARMNLDERILLTLRRLEKSPCSEIEKRALFAAVRGDAAELRRLSALLDRRNERGFRVISPGQTSETNNSG